MNWDYLAGFIDGDGCITVLRCSGRIQAPCIQIGQHRRDILEEIQTFVGTGSIYARKNGEFWIWQASAMGPIKHMLTELVPRLYIKKPHAEALLEYLNCRCPDQHCKDLDVRIRELNIKPRAGRSGMRGGV